ncbi:MAG TPA: O-antigen ligase family protein [Candidatus Dormibacteraeota bacterium]|nr:O-antigen ligase family protein [Candidatus Dormibacteraeota bacterium]
MALASTGVALGAATGELAHLHPPGAALVMALLVTAAGAVFVRVLGWQVGLNVLLVVTCLIDRDTFAVGRLNIRPEQVAAGLALLGFVAPRLRSGRSLMIRPNRAEAALLAWFAVALVSSIVESPNRSDSLKILGLLLVSSLALFLPRRLTGTRGDLDQVMSWTLLAFAFEGAYAYLAYMLHVVGPTISMGLNPATAHLDAYGTLWEPNVLGAFMGAGAVAWIYLGPRYFQRSWIGTSVCLGAWAASFARAAWIAVVVVVLLSVLPVARRHLDLRTLAAGGVGGFVLVLGILLVDAFGAYSQGGIGRSVGNAADLLGRLAQFGPALSDLKPSPLFGRGIDSYGQLHTLAGSPEHLGNLPLFIAHDTGVLGVLALGAFVVFVVLGVWRHRSEPTVLGLGAACLVIAITNQATETLELMVTWVLIGLLLAAVDAAGDRGSSRPGTLRTAPGTAS